MEHRLRIESATEKDVPLLLEFVRELALYEKLLDNVTATEETLRSALFGVPAYAYALLAYENGEAVTFATYFYSFSSFAGFPGLYLEDIYVRPSHRGAGVGRQMFEHLARIALDRGCRRMEWAVLKWNESAIKFYQNLGASPQDEWSVFRLSYHRLQLLAEPIS